MGDIGISALAPKYGADYMRLGDFAYWEVQYDDGTVLSEAAGGKYQAIDRSRMKSFRIVYAGEILMEAFPRTREDCYGFVYRKRSTLWPSGWGRRVTFVFGFVPSGPAYVLDVDASTYRVLENGFDPLDPELYPPVYMPGDPDQLKSEK